MNSLARGKDTAWAPLEANGKCPGYDAAILAVLMDLRDEMKRLNQLLHCSNFVAIPRKLDCIEQNTAKRKYKRRDAK